MSNKELGFAKREEEATAVGAQTVVQEQHILELSDHDWDALQDVIANPPPPNAAMLRSIARWREVFEPV